MNRSDIVLIDFPFSDGTGSKLRPAVIVQSDLLNPSIDDTILALITRIKRQSATEVWIDITTDAGRQSGLHHASAIDAKNLLTIDQEEIVHRLGTLSTELQSELDSKLEAALQLS